MFAADNKVQNPLLVHVFLGAADLQAIRSMKQMDQTFCRESLLIVINDCLLSVRLINGFLATIAAAL